jgi:hypothetical protein
LALSICGVFFLLLNKLKSTDLANLRLVLLQAKWEEKEKSNLEE